eukprot:scaffold25524_cov117-Cylindrotheca_fusiformis.AAC.1
MEDCTNTYYDPSKRSHLIISNDKKQHPCTTESSSARRISSSSSKIDAVPYQPTDAALKRKVRFHCNGRPSSSMEALSNHAREAREIWYTCQELKQCHREIVAIVKQKQRESSKLSPSSAATIGGGSLVVASTSLRGIEDLLSKAANRERRKRKRAVVDNVLQEQARQTKLRIVDPE